MKHALWIWLAVGLVVAGAAPRAEAGTLSVTFTTTPVGGQYAPRNVVAVWIQNQGGTFIKTIGRWANVRKQHLVAWTAAAGPTDADAVSGATRLDHAAPLTVTWNLLDRAAATIPDGTYTIRMELTDLNANTAAQNHQGTFTFVKGPQPQVQAGLSSGGFVNVSINYQPGAAGATCNNGVVDGGETCDPGVAGSCPTSCAASADACVSNVLVGTPATCDAACRVETITACVAGDGCCPDGCSEADDPDCGAGGVDVTGGCETGGGGGPLLALAGLGIVLLGARRRRRP